MTYKIIGKYIKDLKFNIPNPKTFFLRLTTQNNKDLLKNKTSEAYQRGIFGAPTFYINNKIFWGQDRLDFAVEEASK